MDRLTAPLFAACILLAPICAAAQEGEDRNLMWLVRPNAEMFALFYPPHALNQGVAGRVELQCTVRTNERADCIAASEQPDGWGFGEAAVAMSRSFRLAPSVRDGRPVESRLHVPVRFLQMRGRAATPQDHELPTWEDAPGPDAVSASWSRAERGRARGVLSCRVNQDRTLQCDVVHETTIGAGATALALVPEFRVHPEEVDFIAQHRDVPFTLPINLGFGPTHEPVSIVTNGIAPLDVDVPPWLAARFYPGEARRAGVSGSAVVMCVATAEQAFNCSLESEAPEAHGFGAAAEEIATSVSALADFLEGGDWPFLEGDRVRILASFAPAP